MMSSMEDNWSKLSLSDKAAFIRSGVKSGLRNLKDIRDAYNRATALPEVVVTPDQQYNQFVNTLPPNQRYGNEDFNTYRYWELNDKPADFEEAKRRGMYKLDKKDGLYHAGSVAYDKENDVYEFMKSPDHPTVDMELMQYWNSPEQAQFREEWGLDMDSNPYRYVRRSSTDKKLYADGGDFLRNYQWLTMPPTERKYNDYSTGMPVEAGDKVWADAQGNLVTSETPNALADYAAQYRPDASFMGPTLNQINIVGTANPNRPMPGQPDAFEERYRTLLNAPIATNVDVDNTFKEQAQWQHEQSKEKHDMDVKAADARANRLTPGAGTFVVAPVAATLAPILGYEAMAAAPALYSWLTGTAAGQGLVTSTLGGEAVEGLSRLAGYNGFGDMMTKNAGWGNEFGWSFANPGYLLSPGRAAVGTASRVAADALGNVKIANPIMDSLKATMGDYSRGMFGIDPTIAGLTLQYPKAVFNTWKDAAQDYAYIGKRLISKRDPYNYSGYDRGDILPSERGRWDTYSKIADNTLNYMRERPVDIRFEGNSWVPSYWDAEGRNLGGATKRFYLKANRDHVEPVPKGAVKFDNPGEVSSFLNERVPKGEVLGYMSSIQDSANPRRTGFAADINIADDFVPLQLKDPAGATPLNLMGERRPLSEQEYNANKAFVEDINSKLGDLGHVTGSRITALEPYATHVPGDLDIVTTEANLKTLGIDRYYPAGADHFGIPTKDNVNMDVQVIRAGKTPGTSDGMLAREIYAKAFPDEYAKLHSTEGEFPEIPMSPEELLKIHRENVADFAQMDQMISGKDKHILRNVDILASSKPEHISRAYNNMIRAYRSVYGEGFRTLEDQGIHIDYSNVEANKAFLKKLGMIDDDLISSIAESPEKMRFLAEEFAYQRSTANRSIDYSQLPNELVKKRGRSAVAEDAINTNASYSNYAGNWARFLFGGAPSPGYAGKAGVVSSRQFPIRNASNIKTTEGLFDEFARFSTSPEGKSAAAMQKNYVLSDSQIKEIRDLLHIPKTTKIETLNDVLPYTVPNRNSALPSTDTVAGREELSAINDRLADIIGFDYTYSAQSGFDDSFFGVYRSEIPDAFTVKQYITDKNAVGFELPRIGVSKEIETYPFTLDVGKGFFAENSPHYLTQKRKLENAIAIRKDALSQMSKLEGDTYRRVRDVSRAIKAGSLTVPMIAFMGLVAKKAIDNSVEQRQLELLAANPTAFKMEYGVTDDEYNTLMRDYYSSLSEHEGNSDRAYRALKYKLYRLEEAKEEKNQNNGQ